MSLIKIDILDAVKEWQLSVEQADAFASFTLDHIVNAFVRKWSDIASQELNQTRSEYIKSIFVNKLDDYNTIVGLSGTIPNMIEQGISPFDMKNGFEGSSKKKISKRGGWYLTVPFRWATPTAVATSTVFSNQLPKIVYETAKKLKNKESLKVTTLPLQFQIQQVRKPIPQFGNYTHKSSIYDNIQKQSDSLGRSQYTSFRRVSDISDPNSWIHTGIIARKFADKALTSFGIENVIAKAKVDFYTKIL